MSRVISERKKGDPSLGRPNGLNGLACIAVLFIFAIIVAAQPSIHVSFDPAPTISFLPVDLGLHRRFVQRAKIRFERQARARRDKSTVLSAVSR